MCGIIGYNGKSNSIPVLLNGLKRLEYRGYDSYGFATANGMISIKKNVGKIGDLSEEELCELNGNRGMAHCMHPDTLILLSNGNLKKIKELPDEVDLIAYDFNKKLMIKAIGKVSKHKTDDMLKIRTSSTDVCVTPMHKFFVFEPEEEKIIEKTASDLKKGDLLAIPKGVKITGNSMHLKDIKLRVYYEPTELGWQYINQKINVAKNKLSKSIYEHLKSRNRNVSNETLDILNIKPDAQFIPASGYRTFLTLPKSTTPELLRFLGYYFGDGHSGKRCIRFKDLRKEIIVEYKELASRLFNVESNIAHYDNHYVLTINSKQLLEWMNKNFPEIMKKKLSGSIGTLTDEEICSFIGGLYDAEGFVAETSKSVCISISDESAMRKIQMLLLRINILASISFPKMDETHRLVPVKLQMSNKEYATKFYDRVGKYMSGYKRAKINQHIHLLKNNNYANISVPLLKSNIYRKFGVREIRGKGFAMMQTIKRYGTDDVLDYVDSYMKSPILYQRVFDVSKIDYIGDVYDIEVDGYKNFIANSTIQHNSRWATHGGVTVENAHPHTDCTGRFALVHNGIVENFEELKKLLIEKGHKFKSQTDTEVIVHLIEEHAKEGTKKAILKTVSKMQGSFTFLLLDSQEKKLYGFRKDSPLVLGVGNGEMFLASDVPAFLKYTNKIVFIENNQLAILNEDSFELYGAEGKVEPKVHEIIWSFEEAEKGGYEHFMIKEINDQRQTIKLALEQNEAVIKELADAINNAKGVFFVACGTSYHAAMCASYVFSKIAKKHINVVIASEFPNYEHFLQDETLIITISQSGETADVLEAVNVAKKKGSKVASIINVMGSSLMRSSDYSLLLNAGPEICVLATKTYTSQLALLTLLAYASVGKLNDGKNELLRISHRVADVLDNSEYIEELAKVLKDKEHLFLIGRSVSYATALEAALKLKEVSYIHAEALAGGELKHGTLALIEPGVPCIAFVPGDDTDMNILSNAQEIKARGGYIIGVGPKKYDVFDFFVPVPNGGDDTLGKNVFHPILSIIPMQILAYHMALLRNCDPDKPRNLAKSVTVK